MSARKFEEWLVRQVINISDDPEIMCDRIKALCLSCWNESQSLRGKSDADIFMKLYSDGNPTGADIYMDILNNKVIYETTKKPTRI